MSIILSVSAMSHLTNDIPLFAQVLYQSKTQALIDLEDSIIHVFRFLSANFWLPMLLNVG